jgi:signal recognition particle subunit SRP54
MTPTERRDPELLARSPSRKQRIAKGSGRSLQDVTKLIADFQRMRSMMQQMGRGQMPGMMGEGAPTAPAEARANYGKKKKKKKGFGDL